MHLIKILYKHNRWKELNVTIEVLLASHLYLKPNSQLLYWHYFIKWLGWPLVLFLWWYIYPKKTVPIPTWELWPFDPEVPSREILLGPESQGGRTLSGQYKEAGVSLSSEKNCEAASCQSFLSFLYFLFPVAPYWQLTDYSLIGFLYILSHNASSFYFSTSLVSLQYLPSQVTHLVPPHPMPSFISTSLSL